MRRLLGLLFVIPLCAQAVPASRLNICMAWLTTYEQFHIHDKETSILKSDFEGELKRLDLYSIDEIENALDLPMMLSAADKGKDTQKYLSECTKVAKDFTGNSIRK